MPKSTLRFLVITYLFVAAVLGASLGYAGAAGALGRSMSGPFLALFIFAVCFALALLWAWLGAILYVFYDSRARGMDVTLWVLVVAFVPYLIGFVIYFVTRKPLLQSCRACGKDAPREAVHCPHCGAPLKRTCPSCKATAEPEFGFCAACGANLNP
jgi:hypothetical protein